MATVVELRNGGIGSRADVLCQLVGLLQVRHAKVRREEAQLLAGLAALERAGRVGQLDGGGSGRGCERVSNRLCVEANVDPVRDLEGRVLDGSLGLAAAATAAAAAQGTTDSATVVRVEGHERIGR